MILHSHYLPCLCGVCLGVIGYTYCRARNVSAIALDRDLPTMVFVREEILKMSKTAANVICPRICEFRVSV